MFFQGERGKFIRFYALAPTSRLSSLSSTMPLSFLATLWPYSRRLHCTEPGMAMDLLHMSLTIFLTLASMRSMIAGGHR